MVSYTCMQRWRVIRIFTGLEWMGVAITKELAVFVQFAGFFSRQLGVMWFYLGELPVCI